MIPPRCPTCGHRLNQGGRITPRELDVLAAWWMVGSVKGAAQSVGIGEQRAKNLMRAARIRNGVPTNDELLELHFVAVRSLVAERMQHNSDGKAVA
jgi:hypothetical protein